MIKYERNRQQTIPESSVKIIGLGGAGANMLDRVALDGIEGAELLSLNTDVRTLARSVAGEKIQLGRNLTKGLGAGGDPELGERAVLESENEVRDALRERKIVFLCVGLGGGTGSGAAPIVVRLAREAGAFVVVFATMPFAFEGQRRRLQAEESLNQLAVLSNALVTFDNGRMGELVLPKQGVHEAFSAADRMISDSITAVARLVLRPGLINVGLDELMSALKTNRSRCLFGSGIGTGENRAQAALKAALSSPLLDRGSLLQDATTVLIHICGGEDMTLYEVELLMQGLTKFIPVEAHLLFGAATDAAMSKSLSVTIISALPEERLQSVPIFADPEEAEVIEIEGLEDELAEEQAEAEAEAEVLDEEDEEEIEEEIVAEEEFAELEIEEDEPTVEEDFAAPDLKVIAEEIEEPPFEVEVEEVKNEPEAEVKIEVEAELEDSGEDVDLPLVTGQSEKRTPGSQAELSLEGGPRGRFEGETPNVVKGEDLDVPPYLRRKGRRR
ncbi:MAG: cell division protein FtsZ [Akkermansiaceae bacterium]|jgi:cell division protein FtsZ